MSTLPLPTIPRASAPRTGVSSPPTTLSEALGAAARYARLAAFAAACALYVLLRYVVLRPLRTRRSLTCR